MSRGNRKSDCNSRNDCPAVIVPAGTPDWITEELIEVTITVWQPYYPNPLTMQEAVEIIRNAGNLFHALSLSK